MRTTLDLDDRVLAIARAKASQDGCSLGRAVSELVLDGMGRPIGMTERNGIPVFPSLPGHVIDLELVNKYRDGDPIDDDDGYLLDVNVLIGLTDENHPYFESAHRWFAAVDGKFWATCPLTEASYLRLMLMPAIAGQNLTTVQVLSTLAGLRRHPGHRFLADPTSLSNSRLDLGALVGTKQVTDFHLVNLAASSGAVLATFDRRMRDAVAPADRHLVELIPV